MRKFFFVLFSFTALFAFALTARSETKTAVFAGGCFWCMQPPFDQAKGVTKTVVGYCGGDSPNPTYEQVSHEPTGYRESIEVTYDPAQISYEQLLDIFWRNIKPTQADGQFADIGPSYQAAIFYSDDAAKKSAEASKEALGKSGKFEKPIVTEILPVKKFWPAEEYHQKYYLKNHDAFEAYHIGSGRVGYLAKIWGKSP